MLKDFVCQSAIILVSISLLLTVGCQNSIPLTPPGYWQRPEVKAQIEKSRAELELRTEQAAIASQASNESHRELQKSADANATSSNKQPNSFYIGDE